MGRQTPDALYRKLPRNKRHLLSSKGLQQSDNILLKSQQQIDNQSEELDLALEKNKPNMSMSVASRWKIWKTL
jgi:hypothetical protein